MSASDLRFLRDPRLAAQALTARPAWLWRANGAELLWTNPAGAAILFGAGVPCLPVGHPAGDQIARVAAAMPHGAPPRLERLRGLGTGFHGRLGAALTAQCSRLIVADSISALLVVGATESRLSLAERRDRLLAGLSGAAALATPEGRLLGRTGQAPDAPDCLTGVDDKGAGPFSKLAAEARARGTATGRLGSGLVTVSWLGGGDEETLLVTWDQAGHRQAEPPPPDEQTVSVPPADAAGPASRPSADAAGAVQAPSHLPPVWIPDPPRRRYPLRFIWQMDAEGRFTIGSNEFSDVIGPGVAGALGRRWSEIAAELGLDPAGEVARAVATRSTWSGITVMWPADDLDERLPVELSALPVFGRDRSFKGYRGFGVCRDLPRLDALAGRRAASWSIPAPAEPGADTSLSGPPAQSPAADPGAAEPQPPEPAGITDVAPSSEAADPAAETAKVVPFPGAGEARGPALTPVEHSAFRELARRLNDRLGAGETGDDPAEGGNVESGPDAEAVAAATGTADSSAAFQEPAGATDGRPAAEDGRLVRILSAIGDGVLTLDAEHRIVEADPRAAAVFGTTPEAMAGRDIAEWLAADSERLVREDLHRAMTHGTAPSRPCTMRRHDGTTVPLALAFVSAATAPVRIFALLRDLTAWHQLERELHEARRRADTAAADRAGFLAKVSHEVRTPLNTIIGFSTMMMEERFGPLGNERYAVYLKDIQTAGEHVVAMLNDLLDLSRIEAGEMELTPEDLPLNDLIQQCVALMQAQAVRQRVIIRLALSPRLPAVRADARSVRQIMLNLLSRSIAATAAGGQVIVSSAFTDSGDVVLRVRDSGAAISEAEISAALNPFRQLSAAGSWGAEDASLGLPLAKALADVNHAAFSLTSTPNAGTLAELVFPAARLQIPAE